MKRLWMLVLALVLALGMAGNAAALDFSFYGNFSVDDEVQLFNFTVGAQSLVTLRTWSYAGGVNAEGVNVARGGFDPILALFDSNGAYINQNDDGGSSLVAQDLNGRPWDTYLQADLAPGTYTVSVMQFDNFARQPTLADGFVREGQGNFTGPWMLGVPGQFIDVSGHPDYQYRDSHWAFDILNVNEAVVIPNVPIPGALWLLGSGLVGLVGLRKKLRG